MRNALCPIGCAMPRALLFAVIYHLPIAAARAAGMFGLLIRHVLQQSTRRHDAGGSMSKCMGAFSHSAGTAPIITVIIQVTTLKTTHLRNHAQSIQNSKIQTSDACHGSQGPKFCPYSPVHCSRHSMTLSIF